jgi:cyclopropane fatty-acyl-phospholipid synthase-like methyltransferase
LNRHPHESSNWTTYLDPSDGPADAAFFDLMVHPDYPRSSAYDAAWTYRNSMGPNALWLVDALTQVLPLEPGMRVLDLGCGTAITSIFLAREHDVEVFAADLWIEPTLNLPRIAEGGVSDRVFPIEAEAHALPFARGYFDAIVSIDSYHYYGTDVRYLSYLAQFVKPGGVIGSMVPGNAIDPDDQPDAQVEHTAFGADFSTFRSADWWARHFRRTGGIDVTRAEMLPGGHELWVQHERARAAFTGVPVEQSRDGDFLEEFPTMGFVRITARRTDDETIRFGPGRFTTRIA